MSDDLIKRPPDEEFDTMMMVQSNPTGAWMAIQSQADRIEELEAKLIIAVAYIRRHIPDSIYEQRQQARAVLAKLEGQ